MSTSNQDLRKLRLAAMAGNCSAAKTLLRLYGYGLASLDIREGRPFTNKARKIVDLLTAGTNSHWEHVGPDGEIYNDLQGPPPSGKARRREPIVED